MSESYDYRWISNREMPERKGQLLRILKEADSGPHLALMQKVDVEFEDGTIETNVFRNHIRRS